MNAVENIEYLVKKYFFEDFVLKNKSVVNNCTGALVNENNYEEFKKNFEERLGRLSDKISDSSQRNEVIEKIKNLAEKTGYKWSGAYSELVALDFFLSSDYIMKPCFINRFDSSKFPNSLATRNNRRTIDIDFSFELREKKYFTDIKSLIPTQIEVLDIIIESVKEKTSNKKILIGVDDFRPESLIDFQEVVYKEKKSIEDELLKAIQKNETRLTYTTKSGFQYNFNISYDGMLSTMHSKSPYELAKFDKYKYLNYYDKLLDKDYSFLTFVVNPWFNRQINDFCNFNAIYYRCVCRRCFCELKNDIMPAGIYFKDVKNLSITISEISKNIAGILFIEDKSVKKDADGVLYKAYLYLNPNYKNKQPLTEFDFASAFSCSTLSEMTYIDDFQDDNY